MGSGEELDRDQVRKRLPKDVTALVLTIMGQGVRLSALGHGVLIPRTRYS